MKKFIVLFLCFIFLPISFVSAENYEGSNFTLTTDLDSHYAKLIVEKIEAFYTAVGTDFSLSPCQPLHIYYSKTQADTQKLLDDYGHKVKVDRAYFSQDASSIYAHQYMDNGQPCDIDAVFPEIAQSIVACHFKNCPPWFCQGLASFLGEKRAVIRKQLTAVEPNPWRDQLLRDKIETAARPSVKRLFLTSSTERFSSWDIGPHFARALFCWLDETGNLKKYLESVYSQGYELSVLEKTLGKPTEKINLELMKFIKKFCYAGAFLQDGLDANSPAQKEHYFMKALELKPNYSTASFELGKLFYSAGNYEKSRQYLSQVLSNPECASYRDAEELTADICYNEKNYISALAHYLAAWEYSEYYDYKYRTAYKIANCYYKLNDPNNAHQWYTKFLYYNWQPEKTKSQVEYAQKYTGVQKITMQPSTGKPETKTQAEPNKPQIAEPNNPKVRFQTTVGDIVIELDAKASPVTVKNFLRYVEEGFFDGTIFHRVIPDFMIQGGGFTADMQQKQTHEPIINEASNGLKNNRGTIAMARTSDPNSATCQFFINLKNNDFLNYASSASPGYAVFGKVVDGIDVVDKIGVTPTTTKNGMADVPVAAVVIQSAKVITGK